MKKVGPIKLDEALNPRVVSIFHGQGRAGQLVFYNSNTILCAVNVESLK